MKIFHYAPTTSRILFSLGAIFFASGCAAIQKTLAPMVCDCEVPACERPDAEPIAENLEPDYQVAAALALHQVHHAQIESVSAVEFRLEEIRREEEAYAQRPEVLALETFDPRVERATIPLDGPENRERFQQTYGLTPPGESAFAFQGVFRSRDGEALAIVEPGAALRIYQAGRIVASLNLTQYLSDLDLSELAERNEFIGDGAFAMDLVDGDPIQLQLIHGQEGDEGITYFVSIHKQIGTEIGTLFHKPFAHRDLDGELTRFADFRFLRGLQHREIEWIPLNEEGMPEGDTIRYEYNHWEGVYRIPGPPPTAPRRESPQS